MTATLESLAPFCAADDGIKWKMTTPFTVGDWTYATDTKIAVRVPAFQPADDEPRPPITKLTQWDSFPLGTDAKDFPEFADVPEKACESCGGIGTMIECPECVGTGEFKETGNYSSHEYRSECELCDGHGAITKSSADTVRPRFKMTDEQCDSCDGTGRVPDKSTVVVDGFKFEQRYLRLIWSLGNVRYRVPAVVLSSNATLLFETPDGKQGLLNSCGSID